MLRAILMSLAMTAPLAATTQAPQVAPSHENQPGQHQHVRGDLLKSWIDQNKPIIILDARTKPYFDGTLIPTAKWVSAEASEEEIIAAAPDKKSVVVVYCAGVRCPASGWLYDRLQKMGYSNIFEYHEGLQDWVQRGYPVNKQQG